MKMVFSNDTNFICFSFSIFFCWDNTAFLWNFQYRRGNFAVERQEKIKIAVRR